MQTTWQSLITNSAKSSKKRKMIGKDFVSSVVRVGYSPVPTEFHCHLCNASFTKRKFLKMHCDGLFHRDKVILSQSSTACLQPPANQHPQLLFMPAQSNNSPYNRTLYFETDPSSSGRRFDEQSGCDGNLEKRNDVIQGWTKTAEESATSSMSFRLSSSPEFCSGSESVYGHEVDRTTADGVLFDHRHTPDSLLTQTGKRSYVEEFHGDVRMPLFETVVSDPCRTSTDSNVMNEFDCKLCQRVTWDGSTQNEHFSSLEHCKLLLLRQHELGLSQFHRTYGDVPFRRILSASVPVPPPEFDPNLTRIYRSAVVNELHCRACGTEHEDLMSWFGHSLGDSHSKRLYELLHQSDVYMFLSMFGDLPLPESMLPLLNESGGAKESNSMQMPRERSSLNQLETNLKPLENFKVIDHNFASVETPPLKKRLHSAVDSLAEYDELTDNAMPTTVSSAAIQDRTFRNTAEVIDYNFHSVPEVKSPHDQNLTSSSPTRLLESLSENLWLLKVASLSSRSASLLHRSSTNHMSHRSELQLSSEGTGSKPDQMTERLHLESSGAKDLPAVSEFESLEQLNRIVEDFHHISDSCIQNDGAINGSQCAVSKSDCQKEFGEISRISVVISDPAKRMTSPNERIMMSEEEEDLTAAPFPVDLARVDDAAGRIPVLTSSFRIPSASRFVGGCTFEHLSSVAPQPNFSQLEVASKCEEIAVMVSCRENDQSEYQITSLIDGITDAVSGLDGWDGVCGSLSSSTSSSGILQSASQSTAGDIMSLVETALHPNYAESQSGMSISELCLAIPVVCSSKETCPSDVANNNLKQPYLANDVASGVKQISNGDVKCLSSSSARHDSQDSILVASQTPVDREGVLLGISVPSSVTAAVGINYQSKSIQGVEVAKTNHEPVCFSTTECTSLAIPAVTLIRPACNAQAANDRTEDIFGTATVSVCASACSSILPYAPKFLLSPCTLTMPTDMVESMHSTAPNRLLARDVDANCPSASAITRNLSLLASAADAVNPELLQHPITATRTSDSDADITSPHKVICPSNSNLLLKCPLTATRTADSDADVRSPHKVIGPSNSNLLLEHPVTATRAADSDADATSQCKVICPSTSSLLPEHPMTETRTSDSDADATSQHQVICPSNSKLHVSVSTCNGPSVESSDSASNSLHPSHSAATLSTESKQGLSADGNADINISLACTVNPSILIASLLTDSATFKHPSATVLGSFCAAADSLKSSSPALMMSRISSASDEMLEPMTYLSCSVPTMSSKSPAFIDALSCASSMTTPQATALIDALSYASSMTTPQATALIDALSYASSMTTPQATALIDALSYASSMTTPQATAVIDALSNEPLMTTSQATSLVTESAHIKLEPISEAVTTIDDIMPTLECLLSVISNTSKGIFITESTITTDVLCLSAAVSTAKTDMSEHTNSIFSTAANDNLPKGTSFDSSGKTVVQSSVSHDASLVTVAASKYSLGSTATMAIAAASNNNVADTVSPIAASTSHVRSTLQFSTTVRKCSVENSSLQPVADVDTSTLQGSPCAIETTLKCEENQSETKNVSQSSATDIVAADDVEQTIISMSVTDAQNRISVQHEPSVMADRVEGSSQSTTLSTVVKITASAAPFIDNTVDVALVQNRHSTPTDVLNNVAQTTSSLTTTAVQSAVAKSSGTAAVRLVKRKLLRCSPSTSASKDSSTELSTPLLVTGVKNTVQNASVKIKNRLSVIKDNAAVPTTAKVTSCVADTKVNDPTSENSSWSGLANVPKAGVRSVPAAVIKCTSVTTKTISSKPFATQSRLINSPKKSTASNPALLLATRKVIETTARITSAKAGGAVPLMSVKTSLSNSNPCVHSMTVATNKSQPSISTTAVAKLAIISTPKSTTAAALKSSKMVAGKTSVTSVSNCCSVAMVTSEISTVGAQSRVKSSIAFTTSSPASRLVTGTEAAAKTTSRTTWSLAASKPSTSSGSVSRAATSAPKSSVTIAHHSTTATDSEVGPTISINVVIKTEPSEDSPILLGDDNSASNSESKESLASAADLKRTDSRVISERPPVVSRSTINPRQSLPRTLDRTPSCSMASTSPEKREWTSSVAPRNQPRFCSQINNRQARWGRELEARENRFSAPLFGQDVHDRDYRRRDWSDSGHSNSFYRRDYSPPPKIRRLMPRDDDIYNMNNINDRDYRLIPERRLQDNVSDRDYRFTPDRRLQEFADCLKEVAVILQRNGQRFSIAKNITFELSMPWLERQRLKLLSEFTGIRDSRLLQSASQQLARLDRSLLQRFTDLELLCSQSSANVRVTMMQLLEALEQGCHRNLF